MEWVSLFGVLLSVALFIILAYRGHSVLMLALLGSFIVAVSGQMNLLETFTTTFSTSLTGFAKSWILVYICSAIFARFMDDSGAARTIATKLARLFRRWPKYQQFLAIMSLPLVNGFLTYGGVSSLVVVFIMVGLAKDLFMQLDIPWHFYGVAALGSATFAIGLLPGAPDVLNLSPGPILGTTPMAAPGLGILGTLILVVLSTTYVWIALKKAKAKGEVFLPTGARIAADAKVGGVKDFQEVNLFASVAPCIVLLIVMNVFKQPALVALVAGNLAAIVLFHKQILAKLKDSLASGSTTGINTCILLSSTVAFGAVVTASPAYTLIVSSLDSISGTLPPAFQVFLCVNVVAAITSSSTASITIVLNQFAERFLETGLAPEAIHRLATATSLALNTLPHSAGVVNAATASRLTHGEIYRHYLWITVIFPFITAFILCVVVTMGVMF